MHMHTPAMAAALFLLPICAVAADPPAPAPATASSTAPSTATAAAPDAAAIARAAHLLGFKVHQHDGKSVYCKSETKEGATFPSITCLSEDQVMAAVKRSGGNKDSVEALQRAFMVGAPPPEPKMGMRYQ